MSYTALYRKYRPSVFSDVIGQEHIVTTLRNQIRAGRTSHAYLFCGTRGTGKTTVAKILARAVNCEAPVDGEPCGKCRSCQDALAGKSLNIIEIDGASNNRVEDVRVIREEVAYPPARGKKVYIIDEVHMLTPAAFNALLKTLEEPPAYVVFILATTEAHKVPVTILSRCQRYDFRRISTEDISQRLTRLLQEEGIAFRPEAIRYIARKADGGMRDALSLADRCISFYMGQELTYERVLDVLGAVDVEMQSTLLRSLLSGEIGNALKLFSQLVDSGRDVSVLVSDFLGYLRDLLLLKTSEQSAGILEVSGEQMRLLQEDAAIVRDETLMRYIFVLSELSSQMRFAYNKRVLAEVALIRLGRPQMQSDELSVMQRLRRLEQMAEQGYLAGPAPQDPDASMQEKGNALRDPGTGPDPVTDSADPMPKAAPEDLQQIETMWQGIVSGIPPGRFHEMLSAHSVRMFDPEDPDGNLLVVAFTSFLGETFCGRNNEAYVKELEALIRDKIGKDIRVSFILKEDALIRKQQLSVVTLSKEVEQTIREHIDFPIETL